MSITNRSVDVTDSSADLAFQLGEYTASYEAMMRLPDAEIDDAHAEWLESGIEIIEDELAKREQEDNEGAQHYDSPSIQDTLPDGVYPSYAN